MSFRRGPETIAANATILILNPSKDELQRCIRWNSSFDGLRMRMAGL
jgi:hypothetical protein